MRLRTTTGFQDAWRFDPRIKSFATASHIRKLLSTLYNGNKVTPFQTLNFRVGTQQPAHSDSIHFNSEPFGMMCGVWLALEDIGDDQGPLVYYPGSHKLPEMNFDALGLSPKGNDFQEYSHAIRKVIDTQQLKPPLMRLLNKDKHLFGQQTCCMVGVCAKAIKRDYHK